MVWAEGRNTVSVDIEGIGTFPLAPSDGGYFESSVAGAGPGARYRFVIDGLEAVPDLASKCQPEGNDGPSMVDVCRHVWTDADWGGPLGIDEVLYELHIGTFTAEGTWSAAMSRLVHLKDMGISVIQLMPVATFSGAFGWGYDTTLPFAPYAPYGSPDDMRAFVDAAHDHGIAVILDVVYNHVGLGDHYRAYSPHYLTDRHENEWGAAFNFDGEHSFAVRNFIVANAIYWVLEFHLDGLRIDAAQAMFDNSQTHILAELTDAVRSAAAPRRAYIVIENQPQERQMIEPTSSGGFGMDAMYSDDFQHAMRVAGTGQNAFYYRDYAGSPQELVSAIKYGFLYQGQRSDMRNAAYGTYNLSTPHQHFLHFLENHDQVANAPRGQRLPALLSPARLRAMTALLLLGPETPVLFQGQEFASTKPFNYFFGLTGDMARQVAQGRAESLRNFPSVTDPAMSERLPDPADPHTFQGSKLDWSQASSNAGMLRLHRDLLALRRSDPSLSQATARKIDGAVLGEAALLIRYLTDDPRGHRLLFLNLGRDLNMAVTPEPLLAPPQGHKWRLDWSSEHPDYGGEGRRPADLSQFWVLPADCAIFFSSEPA